MGTHPIFESDFDCLTVQIKIMFASKTVAELKAECKARGLPVTGKKQELIDRLTANESEKSMEDDLLEEPDVSLGEESLAFGLRLNPSSAHSSSICFCLMMSDRN